MVAAGSNPGRLPAGYTELAWIQTNSSAWIDTNIIPSVAKETEVEMVMARVESYPSEGMGSNNNLNINSPSSGKWKLVAVATTVDIVNGEFVNIVLKQTSSGRFYSINGVSGYGSSNQQANKFYLGALGGSGVGSYRLIAKFKSVRVKENNVLVMDLVPAMRDSDSVVGMYDLANNTFLTNASSGTFNYGTL